MSLTNQVENRILIAGSMAVTLLGVWLIFRLFIVPTYTSQIDFLQKQNAQKDVTITELAKIAKYSINNDFEKMCTKKGGSIVLDLNNKMDVESQEIIIPEGVVLDTTFTDTGKKSIWKRLFEK
jgi:ribosome biogenesis SPOUT family RNA methylase Rps3